MYIAGQVVMILGAVGQAQNQLMVNLINNSILLVSYHILSMVFSIYFTAKRIY